jgi:hypothetical protein
MATVQIPEDASAEEKAQAIEKWLAALKQNRLSCQSAVDKEGTLGMLVPQKCQSNEDNGKAATIDSGRTDLVSMKDWNLRGAILNNANLTNNRNKPCNLVGIQLTAD